MLTQVKIMAFKSIGDSGVELELKPLTILVGPNGSGKSSILEALRFFRPRGNVSIPQFTTDDLLHRRDFTKEMFVRLVLDHSIGFEAAIGRASQKSRILADDIWLDYDAKNDVHEQTSRKIEAELSHIRYKSAFRGELQREVPTKSAVEWSGPKGEDLLHVLIQLDEPENIDQQSKVDDWARKFGIQDLWARTRGRNAVLNYRDLGAVLPGISASYGARQVLPIIADLFYCPAGSIFLIEEPEISLHPEAQVKLVEMFAEAIKENKQVILTTHSSLLIMALHRPIQKGTLAAKDVAIYDVTKGGGGTRVERLELNEKGYIKGWIPSFKKVEQELMGEWEDSLPEAEAPPEAEPKA